MVEEAEIKIMMGVHPTNREGDTYIIDNLCKNFPGRKGFLSKALIDKANVKPGQSLYSRKAWRNLTNY